jgi:hypothetical protein
MLLGLRLERQFWGEKGLESCSLLAVLRDRLEADRSVRTLEVDDGWQPNRDLGVQIGRWSWLDVRALIEDHGSGKRMARVGFRVRLSPVGVLTSAVLLSLLGLSLGSGSALGATIALAVGAGVVVLTVSRAWRTARTLATVDRAVTAAASLCGLQPVGARDGTTPASDRHRPRAREAHS